MDISMKANGKMITEMGKEYMYGLMGISMKANTKMIKEMGKE